MAVFDEHAEQPVRVHEIGQDLSLLSVAEIAERIGQLQAEIVRLEKELHNKSDSKSAAEALFKR